ncbi:hypothetical protein M419DRAFT_123986 [Trichoderma reesei RUT C-30]|uniref:Uncharacterized protein n=1 Tax=Hypocrea jecorina (strain ATCC 56765 / BCRC 32924 / NRRL 11460 / Rut C-30) TaxID=1344414 RepID=A0A024S5S3_HYPJR|nr:hypothetical protein M419DRAFT_123986 [Trichoderma reesei RUT C-30]
MPATTYMDLTQSQSQSSPVPSAPLSPLAPSKHQTSSHFLSPVSNCCSRLVSSLFVPSLVPICVIRRALRSPPSNVHTTFIFIFAKHPSSHQKPIDPST